MDVLGSARLKGIDAVSTEVADTFQKPHADFRSKSHSNATLQIVVDEDPELLRNLDDQEIEVIEENTVGQVVQGEDGEYYVVVDDNSPDVSGLQHESITGLITTDEESQNFMVSNCNVGDRGSASDEQNSYAGLHEGMEEENRIYLNRRDLKTVLMDSGNGSYEMIQILEDGDGVPINSHGEPISLGAITTAEVGERLGAGSDPFPQGIKMRRNRVYGQCRCPECGQSFVNTARLERHLAVHQIFGSFLCPLCGKTYKYEYNLFYHWRRTCRDLNELVSLDDRKTMDVNALRQLVDDVALKKSEIGQLEIGINRNFLFGTSPYARLELPSNSVGCRGTTCRVCGVVVPSVHLQKHLLLHRGDVNVDGRSVCGGYFCDLCGIMFRQHFNLIKHWRTSCSEIQANLPEDQDITMDDVGLRRMVTRLMRRSPEDMEEGNVGHMDLESERRSSVELMAKAHLVDDSTPIATTAAGAEKGNDLVDAALNGDVAPKPQTDDSQELLERSENTANVEARSQIGQFEGKWNDDHAIVFADDFIEEEEGLVLNGDGLTAAQNRAKWSLSGGPVQCPECFRSFANSGRLERHLAGFHASFGSHHCILCGNRFKYDYNLLYHYRRSCPYTKAFVELEVREEVDAMSLRKLVRELSQREVSLLPYVMPKSRLHFRDPVDIIGSRRQLLRYPNPANQPPPHLLVPRPGLGRGKSCPVCSVIFYGNVAIERHLKAAHPVEYEEWNLQGLIESNYFEDSGRRIVMQEVIEEPDEIVDGDVEEVHDPPPTLTAELPVEQPIVQSSQLPSTVQSSTIRRAHFEEDEHGNQRIVDENGIVIEGTDGEVRLQIDDTENLRQFIESVQIQVPDGEIIFVEENDGGAFTNSLEGEQIIESDDNTYVQAEEFVEGNENAGKYYERNISFVKNEAAMEGQKVQQAFDPGLEVAAILTRMKQPDTGKIVEEQVMTREEQGNNVPNDENGNLPRKRLSSGVPVMQQSSAVDRVTVEEELDSSVKRQRLSRVSQM